MTAWLIGALVALAGIAGAWLKGRASGKADAKAKQDAAFKDTVERAKDADLSSGDADADREWLRKRGKR